jgi:polysaccharide export outer membrane protein
VINLVTLKLRWLALFALSLTLLNAGTRIASAQTAETTTTATADSAIAPIGPGDPLNVTVIGEPDLSNTYVVDADGNIQMPYVSKIHVGGLSPDDAQTLIQTKLSAIYTSPQVQLTRNGLGGISVTVVGAVSREGTQALRRDAHLNDVIQLASPTSDADLKHVNITHGLPGERHSTDTVDLSTFLNAGDVNGNPTLRDGDSVFVPKSTLTTHSVSITGEVAHPGRYDIAENATVFDLITLAGGLTASADPTATYIQPEDSTTAIPFNYTTAAQNPSSIELNPILKDGDQIVVPLVLSSPTYAITGAVLRPGEYPLKGQISLLEAISAAGGLENYARASKTKITRMTGKGPAVIMVDASDTSVSAITYLQAGDDIQIAHGNPKASFNPFEFIGTALGIYTVVPH